MSDEIRTYQDAKRRQLDELATYRVYGSELEFDEGSASRRRWRLVRPCLCVHDSPDSPCPCPPHLWWLRADMIVDDGDADREDHEGNKLQYFDVLVESKIMVETMQSVSAGALKRLGKNISERAITDLADSPDGRPGSDTIAFIPPAFWIGVAAGLTSRAIWEGLEWLGEELGGDLTEEETEEVLKRLKQWGFPT